MKLIDVNCVEMIVVVNIWSDACWPILYCRTLVSLAALFGVLQSTFLM